MLLQYYHFSVDDVFNCLWEVSHSPALIFQHHFFHFIRQLNMDYGAIIDLYTFLGGSDIYATKSLQDVSTELRYTFAASAWLRFGPHAQSRAAAPYAQTFDQQLAFCQATYRELLRFAGPDSLCEWVRLHYFSECFELAAYLKSQHVTALLTTDKPAISYRLPSAEKAQLREQGTTDYNEIRCVRSHIRVEDLVGVTDSREQLNDELVRRVGKANCAVVFTHEYELNRPEVRLMTVRIFDWIQRHNLLPVPRAGVGQQNT